MKTSHPAAAAFSPGASTGVGAGSCGASLSKESARFVLRGNSADTTTEAARSPQNGRAKAPERQVVQGEGRSKRRGNSRRLLLLQFRRRVGFVCLGCASLQVGVPGTAHSVHELVPVLGIPRTFAALFVDFATKSTGPIGGDLLLHDFCSLQEQTTHLLSNSMFSSDPSVPGKAPLKPREILLWGRSQRVGASRP